MPTLPAVILCDHRHNLAPQRGGRWSKSREDLDQDALRDERVVDGSKRWKKTVADLTQEPALPMAIEAIVRETMPKVKADEREIICFNTA